MFERDYLLRLLTQSSLILGRALGLRMENKQQEALDLIDEFLGKELRLRSRLAMGLSDEDLMSMLSFGGAPNAESVAVIAAFLQREAELLSDLGQFEQSFTRFTKALRLNIYLLRNEMDVEGWDIRGSVEQLVSALSPYLIDTETKCKLWDYYEWEGRLSDAEDLLYQLQEESGVSKAEGDAFYERLLELDDKALESGGLSRAELTEGRIQWGVLMKESGE